VSHSVTVCVVMILETNGCFVLLVSSSGCHTVWPACRILVIAEILAHPRLWRVASCKCSPATLTPREARIRKKGTRRTGKRSGEIGGGPRLGRCEEKLAVGIIFRRITCRRHGVFLSSRLRGGTRAVDKPRGWWMSGLLSDEWLTPKFNRCSVRTPANSAVRCVIRINSSRFVVETIIRWFDSVYRYNQAWFLWEKRSYELWQFFNLSTFQH